MSLARDRIDALLDEIESHRSFVDGHLHHPARWRGATRREFARGAGPGERSKLAAAFNSLVERRDRAPGPVTSELLQQLHEAIIDGGGDFRARGVRVGTARTPHHRAVPRLVEAVAERAGDGVEPPLLAAARLHMELLIVHPFSDGNGRVARLAAASVLLDAGFKSTLFTAVEQHSSRTPGRYPSSFRDLHLTGDQEAWLVAALEMMRDNSAFAAEFRRREAELRSRLEDGGVPPEEHDRILLDFDLDRPGAAAETALLNGPRFIDLASRMSRADRAAYHRQVLRTLEEAGE